MKNEIEFKEIEFKEVSCESEREQFIDLICNAIKIYSDNCVKHGLIGSDQGNGWCDDSGVFVKQFACDQIRLLEQIAKRFGFKSMFVAKKMNSRTVIGALWASPAPAYHTCYLSFLSVRENFRGVGVGSALHAFVADYYMGNGWNCIVEAQPDNVAAVRCMYSGTRKSHFDKTKIRYITFTTTKKE